jgi:hypothetical protein
MANRQLIVTYMPRRAFESVELPQAVRDNPPSPAQLAEFSRALQLLEGTAPRPGVMTTVQDEMTSNLQTFLAAAAASPEKFPDLPTLEAKDSANQTLEVRFDEHDILGWAKSFFTWWQKAHKFPWAASGAPQAIDNACRVAVLADWGTGLYGAPACAKSIEKDGKFQLVAHLGDVYYSATQSEIDERFSAFWPNVLNAINRGLNGNHEMYTGGNAYFATITKAPFGQTSSYFAMENDNWLLGFLDTAYADHDLYGDQPDWLKGLAAARPNKKLVLFSHHQPYSLLDHQGPNLIAKLGALLEGRIYAWYWGHEHHCIIYDKHPLWGVHGRCIGHSGYPYFRDKRVLGGQPPATPLWRNLAGKNLVPGAKILDGANDFISDHGEDYGPNGYVTLEFSGPRLVETYCMPGGDAVLRQEVK